MKRKARMYSLISAEAIRVSRKVVDKLISTWQ